MAMLMARSLSLSLTNKAYRLLPASTGNLVRFNRQESSSTDRKKVVILGTGWGSYAVLKTIDKKLYDVVVVSPRNHFLFTPLLASTTVGTLEFRSIVEPIRNSGFRHTDHFHHAYAYDLDPEKQILRCESMLRKGIKYDLTYDKLVIGVGALSNTFGVPGVPDNVFFLKEVTDARKIRDRLLSNFELAISPGITSDEKRRLLHIVIVGGGPTGVEFGAELYDFVEQDISRLYKDSEHLVQVTLIESNQILGSFDARLRSYAEKKIRKRNRFTLVQSAVVEVHPDRVVLSDGAVLPCGLVVWSTGLAPRTFTKSIPLEKNQRGQILTKNTLEVPNTPPGTVYAIGDCAEIADYSLPCTAQVAEKQGRYLTNCLNKPSEASSGFSFKSQGMLAYVGGYSGISELPDVKLKGVPSFFLWRSAYLTRLGSWRLRMQVPLDWLKTIIYGRDTSRF